MVQAAAALHQGRSPPAEKVYAELGTTGYIMCHLSHSYHSGACLYFTFAFRHDGVDPLAQYDKLKSAIQQQFVDSDGTLSHHHAVGTEHARWLDEDISAPGVAMISGLFAAVDPGRNFNPGKIVAADPHLRAHARPAFDRRMRNRVPLRDRLLALLVAVVWGVNFPATAFALQHFPPLFMVALRFALVAIPTLIFVPRPQVPVRWLIGVGLGIGLLQFAFLYLGMAAGMPSGLASLVLQASAPFTVLIAGIWLHERISRRQAIGIGVAVAGLAAIAVHRAQVAAAAAGGADHLCGALGWAIGNICSRQARAPKPLHLTLWMSVSAADPDARPVAGGRGPRPDRPRAAHEPDPGGAARRCSAALHRGPGHAGRLRAVELTAQPPPVVVVAPFSMLVPVVGVLSSWLFFDEIPDLVELIAGVAVIGGVLYASRMPTRTPIPVTPPT